MTTAGRGSPSMPEKGRRRGANGRGGARRCRPNDEAGGQDKLADKPALLGCGSRVMFVIGSGQRNGKGV